MKKLWQKNNEEINAFVEEFETQGDLLMDSKLIPYDILGSIAHVKMLYKIGILTKKESNSLQVELSKILKLYQDGKFILKLGDEDIHTKIEDYLTQSLGEAGKKVHTFRSRNDQVLTAIRLFSKDYLNQIEEEVEKLISEFETFSGKNKFISMPGYTHMQKAMPSSMKLWSDSFKDSLKDDLKILKTAIELNDQSPLGSAAGYGLPINIDRAFTAKKLGFSKVQENPIYCQNSRGKIDGIILASLVSVLQSINKFSSDVMLFTTSEFNYFIVSQFVTTGSSIMPQKKNVDLAELLRSKVHLVMGNYTQLISLSSNLISGYNRDIQDSKKPLFESLELTLNSIKVCQILLKNIKPNKKVLNQAMTEDLFSTEKALKMVMGGLSFRDAYQKVGKEYARGGDKK
ncbi:MAG: argininosuccinate lyase [Candidatus Levybacteria bacterium]|nr:argininosuccinate lyase [Candidatus Levybacteria bacterium]